MIAANVAAADWLLAKKIPAIYRVHEPPSEEKLEDLKTFLQLSGYSLHVGAGIRAAHFNRVLRASADKPEAPVIHTAVLRSQMQAYYAAENLGHFGLSLQKYTHFTSPIRRYSDLVVHRALVSAMNDKTMNDERKKNRSSSHPLPDIALHISDTERRAMMAERDAADRYKVAYMSRRIGEVFHGSVVSLNEFGLFVSLRDNGVTGFIPVRNLSAPGGEKDYFTYDKKHAAFRGQRSRIVYGMGQVMMVRVQSANAVTGSLIFEPAATPDEPPARSKGHQMARKKHKIDPPLRPKSCFKGQKRRKKGP
jgi:ribonuclease R